MKDEISITEAAKKYFGLDYLYPYQRLVITNILEAASAISDSEPSDRENLGRQIVILPTGAGKSLCFQLPALLMDKPTLVIYPILGLMSDQERRLTQIGFSPVVLRGGQSREERDAIWAKLYSGKSKFIIANPEVLLTPQVINKLEGLNIMHIVVDEAHCVSEWGQTFRPAYLEIPKIILSAKAPLITAFTATAGTRVLEKIRELIFGTDDISIVAGNPDRKNISYAAKGCILPDLAVRDLLLKEQKPAIVFCSSRPGTENLARYLRSEACGKSMEIRFYHAGLSREEKKDTENWFLHSKDAVLVSTCAFGLGIDKPDIRTVIHRDCPPSVEAYLQESGRAGRDGNQSTAILLWEAQVSGREGELQAYARDTRHCRRQALLNLLGVEAESDSPGEICCDVCLRLSRSELREESSLLDFFHRNKRSFSITEAADILAQAENIDWTEEQAVRAIKFLLKTGKLKETTNILFKDKLRY